MVLLTLALRIVEIGLGASIFMDIVGLALHRLADMPRPDYAPVGRWIGHMPHGRFRHVSIAAAIPVAGEGILGWGVHYATGIAYAALLVAIRGAGWVSSPTLLPALVVGLVTILVPFLVMQPAFGLGIASSRHPRPWSARLRSLINHLSFGLGLYLSAELFAWLHAAS